MLYQGRCWSEKKVNVCVQCEDGRGSAPNRWLHRRLSTPVPPGVPPNSAHLKRHCQRKRHTAASIVQELCSYKRFGIPHKYGINIVG